MALPTYTISTSVVNVDCTNTSKVLFLPPASTIQGVSLIIRDCAGTASDVSTAYISTQGLDRMDTYASTLQLSTAYQSIRVVAWKPTEFAILQNYIYGITPFAVKFEQGLAWNPRDSVRNWSTVAVNLAGDVLLAGVAGGFLYRSIDSGASWTQTGPSFSWSGVALSLSGVNMVAVSSDDRIYVSLDTGSSWSPKASIKPWSCVCCSSDGAIILAGVTGDTLYLSTDTGETWSPTNITADYTGVACSADGVTMYAVTNAGQIYVSTDTGSSWTARDSSRNWTAVACTSDGVTAFATEGTYIYKSTDTGTSWNPNLGYPGAWDGITCSLNADIVIAINSTTGYLNFSENFGSDYKNSGDPLGYTSVATNGSGSVSIASVNPGLLYLGLIQLL
jgi:photosystem II stability/assembly factor-like uncharacterized protein